MYYGISLTLFLHIFCPFHYTFLHFVHRPEHTFLHFIHCLGHIFLHLGKKKENVLMCNQCLINTFTHSNIPRLLILVAGGDTGAFALDFVEDDFADAEGGGGNLQVFVVADVFHGLFEGELDGICSKTHFFAAKY